MATVPLLNTGVQGLRDGQQRALEAAERVVASAASGDVADLAEAAVELKQAELQVKASARVVESADRTLGSIIDILA